MGIFEPKISELTPGGSGRKDGTLATQVRKVAPRRSRDAKTTPRTLRIACACLWQSQSAKIVEMVEVFAPPLRVRMLIPVSGLAADAALCAARLKTPAINRRNVVLSLPPVNGRMFVKLECDRERSARACVVSFFPGSYVEYLHFTCAAIIKRYFSLQIFSETFQAHNREISTSFKIYFFCTYVA